MNGEAFFIAGTDTGVGKTRVTAALLTAGRAQGLSVSGMKPVASGAELISGRMASTDALQLAEASGQATRYEDLNPYCLEVAISPHIAAKLANITIDISKIVTIAHRLQKSADLLLIEGAGGWYTPLGQRESMADLARTLRCPVVLVVGLKLGCLNHARLSLEAIRHGGCTFAGWIGSHTDPDFMAVAENLSTLKELLGEAPLGLLPHSASNESDGKHMHDALLHLLASRQRQIT